MTVVNVPGKKACHIMLYALSTCGWCRKTKELLKALDVDFEYIDVDTVSDGELAEITDELKKYNPRRSYPTIVVDDGKHVIVGFQDEEIKEVLS